MNIPERFKPFVADLKLNLFEIAYLTDEQLGYFHSDFRIVADYFIQKQRNGDYIPSREKLQHVEAVLQLLTVMTEDTRFEEVLNQKDGSDQGGVHNMCDVLDRVEARGEKKGDRQRMEEDARGMYAEGIKPDVIARIQKVTVDVIERILGLQPV